MVTHKLCTACGETKPVSDFHKSSVQGIQHKCKPCQSANSKQWYASRGRDRYQALRAEVCAAYGGKCQCPHCDVCELEFLTIDHIHGDGAVRRRSGEPTGAALYKWLKDQGFPKGDFQVLCWCCNCAKGQLGECPHVTKHLAALAAQQSSDTQLCFSF